MEKGTVSKSPASQNAVESMFINKFLLVLLEIANKKEKGLDDAFSRRHRQTSLVIELGLV